MVPGARPLHRGAGAAGPAHAARGLAGARRLRWQTTLFGWCCAPRSGGIAHRLLVALARALGETAPLLFTALNNQFWSLRPDQPTASLTVQIFNYAISPYDDWHDKAWSAALVLLLLVGGLSLAARALSRGRFRGGK